MKQILGIFLFLTAAAYQAAASDNISETFEAFEQSQNIRAEAFKAFRAGNADEALNKFEEALALRPNNPLLLGYIAYLSADTGKLDRAYTSAQIYASLGLAPGRAIQAKLEEKLSAEQWELLSIQFKENIRALGAASIAFTVSENAHLVEGIALKDKNTAFVSTVVSGKIYEVTPDGDVLFFDGKPHNISGFFGISFRSETNSLLATFGSVEQSSYQPENPITGLIEIDVTSREIKNIWSMPTTEKAPHQIADITVTKDGMVLLTDAQGKKLFTPKDGKLFEVMDLGIAMSPQGIAELSNGDVILADYSRGLMKLDIKNKTATAISIPMHINLVGIDGLTVSDDKLIAIQNGSNPKRVLEISLSADGTAVKTATPIAQSLPEFMEPTLGTIFNGNYYFVANSQWPKYQENGELREGTKQVATHILKITP